MNYWVIAFPCLMFVATWGTSFGRSANRRRHPQLTRLTIAMGIVFLYQTSQPDSIGNSLGAGTGIPYTSISLALNVLLTLMIVVRLVLHGRNIRKAMGPANGAGGLYNAVVTMIVESSALYAVNSLLFIGPWGAQSWVADLFLPVLVESQVSVPFTPHPPTLSNRDDDDEQVIAPFLIILRVADRRALTSETIVSGNIGSIHFRSDERETESSETLPDQSPVGSVDASGETPGVEATIDEVPS